MIRRTGRDQLKAFSSNVIAAKTNGISAFLQQYCPDPVAFSASFEGVHRLDTLRADERLCSVNQEADCIWIDGALGHAAAWAIGRLVSARTTLAGFEGS